MTAQSGSAVALDDEYQLTVLKVVSVSAVLDFANKGISFISSLSSPNCERGELTDIFSGARETGRWGLRTTRAQREQ